MEHEKTHTEEMLEVWNWDTATPTGEAVPRSIAHSDGIPHEAIHLWIIRKTPEGGELLFQHRSPDKENYPDCLDITVGGHVPFGLEKGKVSKEAREEIGIDIDESTLIDLGWYRYIEKNELRYQRELQHIYLLENSGSLYSYVFTDREVTGIFAVPINQMRQLMTDNCSFQINGYDGGSILNRVVTRKDFHPELFHESMKTYMSVVITAAEEYCTTGKVTTTMPDVKHTN
jgi:isopentenyldiphosphate isomerase